MNIETRNMINALSLDIINMYNINIPILDIEKLVSELGGTIQNDTSFSDGAVEKDGEGFKILISPFQDDRRKRFTIAHELGHLFLHMGYMTNENLWEQQEKNIYHRTGSSEKEYQANEFAAALLMPKDEFCRVLNKNTHDNVVDTSKIAEYFNVSVEAASNRGKFLGYLKW